jgi:hypothetical protein
MVARVAHNHEIRWDRVPPPQPFLDVNYVRSKEPYVLRS